MATASTTSRPATASKAGKKETVPVSPPVISSERQLWHKEMAKDIVTSERRYRVALGLRDILVYGDSGTAKSPFLATSIECEETSKPLMLDVEQGADEANKKGVPVLDINEFCFRLGLSSKYKGIWRILEDLTALANKYRLSVDEGGGISPECPINAFLVDGWTEIYDIMLTEAIRAGARSVEGKGRGAKHDPDLANQNDRGRALVYIKKFARKLRTLPFHIISTAREYEVYNDQGNVTRVIPHLSASAQKAVVAQFDVVGRMRIMGGTPRLHVAPSAFYPARDRSNTLPQEISEPTVEKLFVYFRQAIPIQSPIDSDEEKKEKAKEVSGVNIVEEAVASK